MEAELGQVENLLFVILRLPGNQQVRDLCTGRGETLSDAPGAARLEGNWWSCPCTSRFGRAAPLHREALMAGAERAALEGLQELPQGGELPLPPFQHEGITFPLDPELSVLEGSGCPRSLGGEGRLRMGLRSSPNTSGDAPGPGQYLLLAPFGHGEDQPVEVKDAPADDVKPFLLLPPQLGQDKLLPGSAGRGQLVSPGRRQQHLPEGPRRAIPATYCMGPWMPLEMLMRSRGGATSWHR